VRQALLRKVILGVALLAVGAQVAGCGGSSEASEPSYSEVLRGLHSAALAHKAYGAARLANDLSVAQKAVLHSFCRFAWEMKVNREEWKLSGHPYVIGRITTEAEFATEKTHLREIKAAMKSLQKTISLTSLDNGLIKRYIRACYV